MDFMPAVSKPTPAPPAGSLPTSAAGAPTVASGQANFLQLLAQLISATPATADGEALVEIAASDSKTDAASDKSDDTDADESLPDDVMAFLGICPLPAVPATPALPVTDANSAAIGATQANADNALSSVIASLTPEADTSIDDAETDVGSFTAALHQSAEKAGESANVTAAANLTDTLASLAKAATPDNNAPSLTSTDPNASVTATSMHATTHAQSNVDASAPPRELRSPVGTHAWADELGEHLTLMAQRGHDSASLRLSPEHLGPVEVKISMREGEASVWFAAANADTRAALDQSLPRLREMFASQGMVLADAGVFRDAPRDHAKPMAQNPKFSNRSEPSEVGPVNRAAIAHLRLVDTYV
jgi:flagellar hook-length control protein FliK